MPAPNPSRSCAPGTRPRSSPQISPFKGLLLGAALAVFRHVRGRVRSVPAALDEIVPGGDAAFVEFGHKIPQCRPGHIVGEPGEPGDRDAERQVLVEPEITPELTPHE